jgi:hypothetical protein
MTAFLEQLLRDGQADLALATVALKRVTKTVRIAAWIRVNAELLAEAAAADERRAANGSWKMSWNWGEDSNGPLEIDAARLATDAAYRDGVLGAYSFTHALPAQTRQRILDRVNAAILEATGVDEAAMLVLKDEARKKITNAKNNLAGRGLRDRKRGGAYAR